MNERKEKEMKIEEIRSHQMGREGKNLGNQYVIHSANSVFIHFPVSNAYLPDIYLKKHSAPNIYIYIF